MKLARCSSAPSVTSFGGSSSPSVARQGAQIGRTERRLCALGLQPREVQERVDKLQQPQRVPVHRLERVPHEARAPARPAPQAPAGAR